MTIGNIELTTSYKKMHTKIVASAFLCEYAPCFYTNFDKETMNKIACTALLLAPLMLAACKKAEAPAQPAAPEAPAAVAPAAAPAAQPAELTAEQEEKARKQARLDFGAMEDKYINDPRAQWAASANASSSYGGDKPQESNLPKHAIGPIDGNEWSNNSTDLGVDWIELGYAKPVQATEIRLVTNDRATVESITKIELQDTDGKWNTIWSGVNDDKYDENGPRTWVVRTFEKTPYKVKAVKYTITNNVRSGYKEVDAAQLVGD